jgi:polygalacturonase
MNNRRDFIRQLMIGGGALLLSPRILSAESITGVPETSIRLEPGLVPAGGTSAASKLLSPAAAADAWAQVPRILARIKAPVFPKRDFVITRYGAVGDGEQDCTEAFRKAITACSRAGGGRVVVPAGVFHTGAIHLKSNVNLHVTKDATIKFSRDPKKYLPLVFSRWEGMELMNYSPFIYAFEQRNIAITGAGIIDGNASCEYWWPWKGRTGCGWKQGDPNQLPARNKLYEMVAAGTPVRERIFGEGSYLRPSFIQPYRSRNVLIEGVTLRHSPMWQVHPVLCTNLIVRNVNIEREAGATSQTGPNADGCDPESCKDVLIEGCTFSTGDDCIAIKAGRNNDGRRVNVPSENIIIRNCHMRDGHGGITVGSEISGGVRNVFAYDCRLDSPHLDIAIRFKNNALRGGNLENFYFKNIEVGEVADAAITIDFNYEEGKNGPFTPVVRNVHVDGLRSKKSQRALDLQGLDKAPIYSVKLENCTFQNVAKENIVKNVQGLTMRNVVINGKPIGVEAETLGSKPKPQSFR